MGEGGLMPGYICSKVGHFEIDMSGYRCMPS